MDKYTDAGAESLVYKGRRAAPLTRDALQGSWERSRMLVGRPDLRLHDLRHTGLTLAAATGATTAELMHRAGYSSTPAALRYQHATQDRDRSLSNALESLIEPAVVIHLSADSGT